MNFHICGKVILHENVKLVVGILEEAEIFRLQYNLNFHDFIQR